MRFVDVAAGHRNFTTRWSWNSKLKHFRWFIRISASQKTFSSHFYWDMGPLPKSLPNSRYSLDCQFTWQISCWLPLNLSICKIHKFDLWLINCWIRLFPFFHVQQSQGWLMFWFPTERLWHCILFWKNNISIKQWFPGKLIGNRITQKQSASAKNWRIKWNKTLSQHLYNGTVHED